MAAKTVSDRLAPGAEVVLTEDITGMPAGSTGKVVFVNGLQWIRYWVHFDSGPRIGQIGRTKLSTPAELAAKASGTSVKGAGAAAATEAGGAAGGSTASSNAYGVPDFLLERSAGARARWAAKAA